MGYVAAVIPTNIAGILYEDHYVSFNATASTNPAIITIEYAQTLDDGTAERYSANVTTNSYPDTHIVELQSGSYTCFWFRCAVPAAVTNCVRDWNGEALFGGPVGSDTGFDVLGTLVVDDGDNVWVGATTNMVIGTAPTLCVMDSSRRINKMTESNKNLWIVVALFNGLALAVVTGFVFGPRHIQRPSDDTGLVTDRSEYPHPHATRGRTNGGYWTLRAEGSDVFKNVLLYPHHCTGCGSTQSMFNVSYPQIKAEWEPVK